MTNKRRIVYLFLPFVGAVLAFLLFYEGGKAADCGLQSHDGQCGLSTFVGMVAGAAAAVATLIGGLSLVAWRLWKADKDEHAPAGVALR